MFSTRSPRIAVVDVDTELGLVKVIEITTAQDVGKAMNPLAVLGQIHGGTAQGLGLALMEEIQVTGGLIRNPSFTDYLIPTILDVPPMNVEILEFGDPHAPYGLRGVGEPPAISSAPGDRGGRPRRHRPPAAAGAHPPGRHRRPVMPGRATASKRGGRFPKGPKSPRDVSTGHFPGPPSPRSWRPATLTEFSCAITAAAARSRPSSG
ncbi:MAG: molybdopterin cofactor-binding domain-containing protein [Micromonosporaceae bacterium]